MPHFFDLISKQSRDKIISASEKREKKSSKKIKVDNIDYFISELGFFYGWEAVKSVKLGYIEDFDEETGKKKKLLFTFDDAMVLLEGAKKVLANKTVFDMNAMRAPIWSIMTKNPGRSFKEQIKTIEKIGKVDR